MLSVYHVERAGRPKSPIAMIRYNMSKADNVTRRFKKVLVKFDVLRWYSWNPILNILPSTPMNETTWKGMKNMNQINLLSISDESILISKDVVITNT